jgi:hypothetical protein
VARGAGEGRGCCELMAGREKMAAAGVRAKYLPPRCVPPLERATETSGHYDSQRVQSNLFMLG